MKKKNFTLLILPIIIFALECVPNGVKLSFSNPEGNNFISRFSYFSLTPFGYAVFSPLLVAALTVIGVALILFYIAESKKSILKSLLAILILASIISFFPIIKNAYTVVGAFISILLILESIYVLIKVK